MSLFETLSAIKAYIWKPKPENQEDYHMLDVNMNTNLSDMFHMFADEVAVSACVYLLPDNSA